MYRSNRCNCRCNNEVNSRPCKKECDFSKFDCLHCKYLNFLELAHIHYDMSLKEMEAALADIKAARRFIELAMLTNDELCQLLQCIMEEFPTLYCDEQCECIRKEREDLIRCILKLRNESCENLECAIKNMIKAEEFDEELRILECKFLKLCRPCNNKYC